MSPAPGARRRRRSAAVAVSGVLGAVLVLGTSVPATAQADDEPASIVVTTEVLGAVVADLVGDGAEVSVLMAGGTDPHTYEPSARDAERIGHADLLISNGLDLEEGLTSVLETAQSDGVAWFQATDHIDSLDGMAPDEPEQGGETDHAHDARDPHFWTDPLAMRDVAVALDRTLAGVGIDTGEAALAFEAELLDVDAEVRQLLMAIPESQRKLVTGHRSMGYFADRYELEQIGTVVPGASTSGEPTARELSALISDIRDHGVSVVFVEVGTPVAVAEAVATDSGARLVELETVRLPEDGRYASLIRGIATTVADALGS